MLPTSFPQTFMCAMPSLRPYAIDKDLFGPIKFMKNLCEVRELAQAEQTYIAWFAFPYLTKSLYPSYMNSIALIVRCR